MHDEQHAFEWPALADWINAQQIRSAWKVRAVDGDQPQSACTVEDNGAERRHEAHRRFAVEDELNAIITARDKPDTIALDSDAHVRRSIESEEPNDLERGRI